MDNSNASFEFGNYSSVGHFKGNTWEMEKRPVGHAILGFLLIIISLASVLGNTLVMAAVYVNRNLRIKGNYLLVNLALADFLQGGISIPLRLAEILAGPTYDLRVFCQASIFSSTIFGGNSNLSILFISIERFIAVICPYFYHSHVTANRLFGVIGLTWISSAIFALLPLIGVGSIKSSDPIIFCRFPHFLSPTYLCVLYVVIVFIPIATVTPFYAFILRSSIKNIRTINAQEHTARFSTSQAQVEISMEPDTSNTQKAKRRNTSRYGRQRKSAKIVLRIVGTFIILNLPIFVIDIVDFVGGPVVPFVVVKTAVMMAYANHCVNVLIYTGYHGDFRRTFKIILRRCRNVVVTNMLWPRRSICRVRQLKTEPTAAYAGLEVCPEGAIPTS